MPKSPKPKTYSINELSPEAKDHAIEKFREGGSNFDNFDSDQLTESFEEFLEEKGIEGSEVNWSLGYSQGDGVCFSGSVEIPHVIHVNMLKKFFPLSELAHSSLLYAKVEKDRGRSCHWNSMRVETRLEVERDYFLSDAKQRQLNVVRSQHAKVYEDWKILAREIHDRNNAPIREWEAAQRDWESRGGRGPRDWNPRIRNPGEKPAPLNELTPPAPVQLLPLHLEEALQEADDKVKKTEALTNDFEKWLEKWVQDLSREMEKNGYLEIEYRDSEEVIIDFMDANEWKFLEDGERAPR